MQKIFGIDKIDLNCYDIPLINMIKRTIMLTYRNNRLFIENSSVEGLAGKFGTPLFVYSKDQLISNYNSFNNAFNKVTHIICYALKANSNYNILKILSREGAGVDITSGGELYRSLKSGFKPRKMVYAGIGKTEDEIEYALKNNILMFNVESMEELNSINKTALRLKKKATVAFRINPNIDPHTHHYISTGQKRAKFGIPYSEVIESYVYASKLKGIDVAGIHSHIGSQITEVGPFKAAAERVAGIVRRLNRSGIVLRYVDLGGGLGIRYNKEDVPTPADLAGAVLPVFKDFKGTFIFEPGRYIVGNTGVLVVKVIYRKSAGGKNFLVIDGGMNDLVRPTLYEAYHDIVPVKNPGRSKVKADVVGPICESGDFLGKDRMLPRLEQGEYLAVKCAGAYGFAMSSQYNSRVRAAEVMVDSRNAVLIRGRETYGDLVIKEVKR